MAYSEPMSQLSTDGPRRHRLTVADYYRMGETGILAPDARVELIDGEIFDVAPPGSLHAGTVNRLTQVLVAAAGNTAVLHVQNPLTLGRYSEPQPDLALLRYRADFYTSRHPRPTDALLVIEVGYSSVRFDREVKIPLYAGHSIPETWLIDLAARRLTRYRDPQRDAYARVDQPDSSAALEVTALPEIRVDLGTLFRT